MSEWTIYKRSENQRMFFQCDHYDTPQETLRVVVVDGDSVTTSEPLSQIHLGDLARFASRAYMRRRGHPSARTMTEAELFAAVAQATTEPEKNPLLKMDTAVETAQADYVAAGGKLDAPSPTSLSGWDDL